MTIFYVSLLPIYIFSLYARLVSEKFRYRKPVLFFTILVILVFSLISGLRNNIGDTKMYVHLFEIIGPNYVSNGDYESGFIIFFKMLKSISKDPQFMILVTSFMINILNIYIIRMYSSCFELATYLYFTAYYIVTMNGIRQSLVAACIFACTTLIIKGRFYLYIAVILLLSSVHSSAVVMIPVYFLVRKKAWSREICIMIVLFLVGLIFYNSMIGVVVSNFQNTKYGSYANFNEGGANVIRVIVSMVPVVLAFIKRKELDQKWAEANIFVNMSLIGAIVMCFSVYNWIFARFCIYFNLYTIILLPNIIKNCFRRKEKYLLYYLAIILYFIIFWYDAKVSGTRYKSYFQIMNIFQ